MLSDLLFRLRALFRRKSMEAELDEELRAHAERQAEKHVSSGMPREEAARRARLEFGGLEQIKEECRDARGVNFIETTIQDVRYGLRMLVKNPGFTATAVLSLALGIGANTAIFSLIDALMLRWLPVHKPGELVQVVWNINGQQQESFSYPVIQALVERTELVAGVCGFSGATFMVGIGDAQERTPGAWAAGAYYETLGLQPQVGRLLTLQDDRPGAPLVAVISDGYWTRKFSRNPNIVGQLILIEHQPVTIVGVSPPGFTGANVGEVADITVPLNGIVQLSPNRPDRGALLQAGYQWLRILARPRQGASLEQLRSRLRVLWPAMATVAFTPRTPAKRRQSILASTLDLVPGATGWSGMRRQFRKPLLVLMAVVALVLLIACANVANLLLARVSARQREIAVRLAIGASRGRMIRQLLTESLLLATLGVTAGLALAQIGSHLLLALVSEGSRLIPLDVTLNWRVFGFTIAVGGVTGLLFGLAPAFRATASGPGPALKSDARTASGTRSRLAPALVAAQVALSLLLLIAAGLFVRTLINLEVLYPGFRHQGVLLVDLDGRRAGFRDARLAAFYQETIEAIRHTGGVLSVSLSSNTPLSGGYWSERVSVNGMPGDVEEGSHFNSVSPGYFETMQTPLILGRDFTLHDDSSGPAVVIVNQAFVRRYFPDGHALGRQISVADAPVYQGMEIVGVVKDTVSFDLRKPPPPTAYVPFFQAPAGRMGSATMEIYAGGSLAQVSSSVQRELRSRLPATEYRVRPLTQQVEASIRQERLLAQLAGFFGILALALAAVGLYGLLAYMVARRTGEIGIRMALGAQQRQMLWLVLRDALRLVAIGVAVGLPAAWWASRFIEKMMFGLRATDPITMLGAAAILTGAALLASYIPARRATKVDPMVALRYE